MPPPPAPPPPPVSTRPPLSAHSDGSHDGGRDGGKEYATFSAQFPPPEWTWYQQQLEKQKRVDNWVTHQGTIVSSSSKHPSVGGNLAANGYHGSSTIRQSLMSLQINNPQQNGDYLSMNNLHNLNGNQNQNHYPGMNNAHSRYGINNSAKPPLHPIKPDNFYESFRHPSTDPSSHHHRKSRSSKRQSRDDLNHLHHQHPRQRLNNENRQSVYDFIDQADVTPMHASNVYHSVSGLSPVRHLSDESTYAKLSERPGLSGLGGPLHSTPCNPPTGTSRTKTSERMSYGVEGHEARDRIYGPPDDHLSLRRKSHRSRRKGHKAYSFYGHGDDISIEYKGRLPNKNSSRAQSRDSGVNCVGLAGATTMASTSNNTGKKRASHLYENTPSGKQKHSYRQSHAAKSSVPLNQMDNHVQFHTADPALASTVLADDTNINEVTDPAFCSVVYSTKSMVDQHVFSDAIGGVSQMEPSRSNMLTSISGGIEECSRLPAPYPSLQSDFYDDSSLAQPCVNVMTCEVEINPQAPSPPFSIQELAYDMELIDVENVTDVREVAGQSKDPVRLVTDRVNAISISDSHAAGKENNVGEEGCTLDTIRNHSKRDQKYEDINKTSLHNVNGGDITQGNEIHKPSESSALKSVPGGGSIGIAAVENGGSGGSGVADSGFSSPRNLADDQHHHQSQTSSQNSHTENSVAAQHNSVESQHTHSDVNMVSSEHNSGSTHIDEIGDFSAEEESSDKRATNAGISHKHKQKHKATRSVSSNNSGKSVSSSCGSSSRHSLSHKQQQLSYKPHYSSSNSTAKIIMHPDVYNNNNNSNNTVARMAFSSGPHDHQNHYYPYPPQHHLAMSNERLDSKKYGKRDKNHMHLDAGVSDLHQFEEEQLSRKFGANGEYEVMGVL